MSGRHSVLVLVVQSNYLRGMRPFFSLQSFLFLDMTRTFLEMTRTFLEMPRAILEMTRAILEMTHTILEMTCTILEMTHIRSLK